MARRKGALALTFVTSADNPPLRITLNRWTLGLCILLLLGLAGLASVTVYNLLDGQTTRSRGDALPVRNSSGTREQEQEKLIKLGEDRLLELQKENAARKKDVDDLETRVGELTGSIKSLQQLAKEIEQRIPGGGATPPGQPTKSGSGQPNATGSSGVGGGDTASSTFDLAQSRNYTDKLKKVLGELDNLNATITDGRYNMAILDVQVQSYQATLAQSQQRDLNSAQNARLFQLAGADGNASPFVLPANCPITSPFGMRWSPFVAGVRQMHYGIDIGCYEGTGVAVTKAGIVTYVGYDSGYGNRVEVSHAGGWLTLYGHNNRILVKVGQTVQKGDIISLSGNTGASTGPHIHYELHQNGRPIDPAPLLAQPLNYKP